MASAVEWNLNHGQRNARLFEIGSHYRFVEGKPVENGAVLSIGATVAGPPPSSLRFRSRDYTFADLKGDSRRHRRSPPAVFGGNTVVPTG